MNHQLISQTPASLRDFRPIIVNGKINCISTQMARVDVICSGFLCIALLELSSLFCSSFFWGHFPSETLENTEWRGNIFSQGGRASVKSFTGSNFVTHTGRPALKAISVICETVQIEFLCQWLNTDNTLQLPFWLSRGDLIAKHRVCKNVMKFGIWREKWLKCRSWPALFGVLLTENETGKEPQLSCSVRRRFNNAVTRSMYQ